MGFSADERTLLLNVKGVGPTVTDRLEQIAVDSLETLANTDVDGIVKQIAAMLGATCWKNSPQARAAIAGAIAAAAEASTAAANQPPKRSKKN